MTYGTCYFVSREAAIKYYREYERDPARAVETKLSEGSIQIGKPALRAGETLTIIDDGTRYAVISIALADRSEPRTTPVERDENIRLMASAPELLAALQMMVDDYVTTPEHERTPFHERTAMVARAVIAKATGVA